MRRIETVILIKGKPGPVFDQIKALATTAPRITVKQVMNFNHRQ